MNNMPDARILVIKDLGQAAKEIAAIGAEDNKVDWLAKRTYFLTIKIEKILAEDAIIIKNDMLEIGGNAAYDKKVYTQQVKETDMILSGTMRSYDRLVKRLKFRTKEASKVADIIQFLITNNESNRTNLLCKDKRIPVGKKSIVMGAMDITLNDNLKKEIEYAEKIIEEGADIIDICCDKAKDADEIVKYISPLVKKIESNYSIPICINTSDSDVANRLLDVGAHIINATWGVQSDKELAQIVSSYKAGIILMHNKTNNLYKDIMGEIVAYLKRNIEMCQSAGIGISNIVIDPGIGFGKNIKQDFEIVRKLRELKSLGVPLMVGTSRKEMIGKILNLPIEEQLEGTAASITASILNGADIVRVHDVKQMKQVAMIADAIAKK